ncbi:S-layer homology domain-containing protein [Paenibacillus agricola]|uniref:S-layer homology domain-containing protein n=1 Tax=Paenibacillus agricola TaxID=2716264 RepID=A0ABX0IYL4_9BACL|nr:S-layer homology domain-containing protein [Paenibacillus agricola]NHN29060.1 S-layer homology domain-containing protein [Paenibacillus agricola]
MKMLKQASTVALTSMLLFSSIPMAMAAESLPAATSSNAASVPGGGDTGAASVNGSPASDPAASSSAPVSMPGSMPYTSIPAPMPGGGSSVSPEEAKITKEQAIELAKSYVAIPDGYVVQSVNLSSNGMGIDSNKIIYWNISFTKLVEGKSIGNMNVTINGVSGRLLDYSSYSNDPNVKPSYPPKVDYQRAKEIAAQWIAKLNVNEQGQLRFNDILEQSLKAPLNGSYQYAIRYDRIHNGVAFPMNGINLQINGDGSVTNYSFNWDEAATFEQATPISEEAAAKAFRDNANLKLNYMMLYEAKGEKKPVITYSMDPLVLKAVTGEPWKEGLAAKAVPQSEQPLTESPISEPPASHLNLTKEQAWEKINSTFKLPEGAKQEEASYNESTNPITGEVQSVWNLRWSQAKEDTVIGRGGSNVWATVNSKTGVITSFSRNTYIPYDEQKPVEPKVTVEEAKAKAIDFVKKQLPAYTHQLVLDTSMIDQIPAEQLKMMSAWDISFKRIIDGVYVNQENVQVSIDKATGDMMNYHFNFSNIAYPATKPATIDANKAKELLLSPYVIKLNYVIFNQMAGGPIPMEKIRVMMAAGELPPGSDVNGKVDKEAKLVYVLTSKYSGESYFLDAATGQWRSSTNGEVISLEKIQVTDLEGHWAQKELQIMLDYQALDVADGKVNPNASITRGELIKMLVITMNGGRSGIAYGAERAASFKDVSNGSTYFAYVENAVDRGLIDLGQEFNPQTVMTREEMAGLIVRALGYKKLTAYDHIFNSSFQDAGSLKNRGEAAIVLGLGIMTLAENSFNPKQEVTRAQAAVAFFRYLEKLAELQPDQRYY